MKKLLIISLVLLGQMAIGQDIEIVSDSIDIESEIDSSRTRVSEDVRHTMTLDSIDETLDYRLSDVKLGDVSMKLPKGYKWLPADQVYFVFDGLVDALDHYPYGTNIVMPIERSIFDDRENWILVRYVDSGYVYEQDFSKADFDKYFIEKQIAVNIYRDSLIKYERPPEDLIGWDQKPVQDTKNHRVDWGYEFSIDNREPEISKESRVLGRYGFVEISGRGKKDQTEWVEAYSSLANSAEYKIGTKYEDYHDGDPLYRYSTVHLVDPNLAEIESFFDKYWKWGVAIILLILLLARRMTARKKS